MGKLTHTEIRVIQNLHLRGGMGKMGGMSLEKRRKLLGNLVVRGYLDATGRVTKKGVEATLPSKTL